jgi:hypothetical protein
MMFIIKILRSNVANEKESLSIKRGHIVML